ncbi:MAG: BatD family protein [bacterium]|nr:BatD family protein [bacterium]
MITLLFILISSVNVNTTVDKNEIFVGDRIKYQIDIQKKQSIKLDTTGLPKIGYPIKVTICPVDTDTFSTKIISSNFEIIDRKISEDKKSVKIIFTLTSFKAGNDTIPELTIKYKDNTGNKSEFVTKVIPVNVKSILPANIQDIKDIKPPESIPRNWGMILLILLIIGILGTAGWILYKKRRRETETAEISSRPPYDLAVERLNSLKLDKNNIKKYYIELSDIIRQYIEGIYNISAPTETTFELYRELRKIKIKYEIIEYIKSFLDNCDMVKFAKYVPSMEIIEKNYLDAKEILSRTKPEEKIVISENAGKNGGR